MDRYRLLHAMAHTQFAATRGQLDTALALATAGRDRALDRGQGRLLVRYEAMILRLEQALARLDGARPPRDD